MWIDIRGQSAKTLRFAFAATSACLLAAGCARNEPPAISVGPDLSVDAGATAEMTVTVEPYGSLYVALSGTVRNHATHAPIAGASVTVSQFGDGIPHRVGDTLSDADGAYAIEVPANPGRLAVHAEAEGFAAQSAVVTLLDATAGRDVHLNMVPVQAVREFGAAEGVDVSVGGRSVVTLPANAMTAGDGDAYTGRAVASVAVLDPSRDPSTMPGDFQSWNTASQTAAPIESYGAVSVDLRADNGERLQLAAGDVAQLSIPLANARRPQDAPPTMPMYYWSGELGDLIEEGEARLAEVSPGIWAYVGAVGHFSTWNADVIYESVSLAGCVLDGNGDRVGYAELTARGIDYTGTSSAVADADGRFEIEVRPNSELELVAASDGESSDAMTISSGDGDFSLELCLVVQGERGLEDFPVRIEGETGTIDICVRDHECEDGDAIDVDIDGRNVFSGEIANEAMCSALEVEAGREYVIELSALNGTGFKGACNFADANTGEIVVRGLNSETQVWRHREGAGSRARIVVSAGVVQPFTVVTTPPDAAVRFLEDSGRVYEAGMDLLMGEYRIEVSAPGYESWEVTVAHGLEGPTALEVDLERIFEPGDVFTDALASGGEGPELVVIPAGRFRMGDLTGEGRYGDGSTNEEPIRTVVIAQNFALGKFEVTFAQYNAYLTAVGRTPYESQREDFPFVNDLRRDHYLDGSGYTEWLTRETGEVYRLPTEEEWEYAARAGTETNFYWGNDPSGQHANGRNFGLEPIGGGGHIFAERWRESWPPDGWPEDGYYPGAPVGSYIPNAFGLYDMSGNAFEIVCSTASRSTFFADECSSPAAPDGIYVLRGGTAFNSDFSEFRSSSRRIVVPSTGVGIRVLREIR